MRYEKKVLVLSAVLAALLLAWGAGLLFSPDRAQARAESGRLLSGKAADVASIVIQESTNAPMTLERSGSSWLLVDGSAKLPVLSGRVSGFLDDVAAISRLSLVGRTKDAWPSLELGQAQAKRATLKDGKGRVLADFYLGGYGPTGSELFVRRSGSEPSYSAQTGLGSYFGQGRSGWLDLQVMSGLKESDVQSFSVKSDIALDAKGAARTKLAYELRRDGKGWKAAGSAGSAGASLDAEAVSALLRSIAALQGEDYVAAPPADAFASISARIDLELGSGKSKVLEVGALEKPEPAKAAAAGAAASDGRFYARVSGGPAFLLSSYALRADLKSLADLSAKK